MRSCVYQTKTELYKSLYDRGGKIFVFSGNEELIRRSPLERKDLVIYGDSQDAVLKGELKYANPFVEFCFSTPSQSCDVTSRLVGAYNLPNFLAASRVGSYFGVDLNDIVVAFLEDELSSK